ncbi:hypothetical protein RclHR1_11100002 [Rhizophagus clarus]|nr:hypothetical protein RclHR1_11100002 [Rhizophagus clarus]
MEEYAQIKRQCSKYQQNYSELKAKYDKTLQQLATEKSNELNRITTESEITCPTRIYIYKVRTILAIKVKR